MPKKFIVVLKGKGN